MSDAAEHDEQPETDAWATACEEDLAAEKARRRKEFGPEPVSAAEELRRLADAVSTKVAELGKPFGGSVASGAAQGVARQLIAQAKAVVEPVVERNPRFFDHLAAAGGELLAAYRSAVQDAEHRWTSDGAGARPERITLDKGPADPEPDVSEKAGEAGEDRTGEGRGGDDTDTDADADGEGSGPAS
jgi:hypothetical protein